MAVIVLWECGVVMIGDRRRIGDRYFWIGFSLDLEVI